MVMDVFGCLLVEVSVQLVQKWQKLWGMRRIVLILINVEGEFELDGLLFGVGFFWVIYVDYQEQMFDVELVVSGSCLDFQFEEGLIIWGCVIGLNGLLIGGVCIQVDQF